MTGITAQLWAFWEQFVLNGTPIPAYQTGAVPEDASFPYITFDAAQGAALDTIPLTAIVWVKYEAENSSAAIAQRMAVLEAVSKAIPEGGARLDLADGFMILRRGSGDFLSSMTDEEDPTVLGGRVGYEVSFYTT